MRCRRAPSVSSDRRNRQGRVRYGSASAVDPHLIASDPRAKVVIQEPVQPVINGPSRSPSPRRRGGLRMGLLIAAGLALAVPVVAFTAAQRPQAPTVAAGAEASPAGLGQGEGSEEGQDVQVQQRQRLRRPQGHRRRPRARSRSGRSADRRSRSRPRTAGVGRSPSPRPPSSPRAASRSRSPT